MKMRWFIVEVPVSSSDSCITVGNCASRALAKDVISALEALSNKTFRIVGPITENMIHGRIDPEDIKLVEAQMEHLDYQVAGGLPH